MANPTILVVGWAAIIKENKFDFVIDLCCCVVDNDSRKGTTNGNKVTNSVADS